MASNQSSAKSACRALLDPVVRILLRSGVPFAQFMALAKSVYVSVATRDHGLRGRPTNISRVALLTGMTRREVRRQRQLLDEMEAESGGRVSNIARVLHGWHTDEDYLDGQGKPLALVADGPDTCFEGLYRKYGGGDVPCTTALKELIASGSVVKRDDRLEAVRRYFMPVESDPVAIERGGEVLADLGETVTHNLYRPSGERGRFEGRATSRVIPEKLAAEFRDFVEVEAEQFLEKVDDWLSEHAADDEKQRSRIGIGVYQIKSELPDNKDS